MSNLPGNPFEADAQDDPRKMGGTTANALLALAYEQRTANLIALHQMTVNAILAGATTADTESLNRNSEEIETRLGLRAEK